MKTLIPIFLFFMLGCSGSKSYHIPLVITFDESNIPIAKITIQGIAYPMQIDLGSKNELSLEPNTLETLEKKRYGSGSWIDIKGNIHNYPRYKLTSISLGSFQFNPVFVVEKPKHANCILWSESPQKKEVAGSIGRPLLSKMNLLFDFNNSLIIASNSFRQLKEDGYDLSTYLKVPLEITSKGIFLKIETDFGVQNFFLDTGCTCTFLRTELITEKFEKGFPVATTKTFQIQGYDFGPMKLYHLGPPEPFKEIDGFLGMDFFQREVIYLDFSKKYAYIKR